MKKIYIVNFLLISIGIGSYIGDWNNFRLSGTGYSLKNDNSSHVYLVDEKTKSIIINEQIVDFYIDKKYLIFLRMVSESVDCDKEKYGLTIITHNSNEKEFVVIERKNNALLRLNEKSFDAWKNKENIYFDYKVPETYHSNTSDFKDEVSKCKNTK